MERKEVNIMNVVKASRAPKRYRLRKGKDRKVFSRTAMKKKSINLTYRGGAHL